MATWSELAYQQIAVRSDGAKFLDGERNDLLDTNWLTYTGGTLTLGAGMYGELLLTPALIDENTIAWYYKQRSPFHDPKSVINAAARPITTADNQVRIDGKGVRVRPSGLATDTAILDQDGLKVLDEAAQRQVTVGDIEGLPGVPTGVKHGLWGEAGTGVFIRKQPRVIAGGTTSYGFSTNDQVAGDSVVLLSVDDPLDVPLTIPEGKAWAFMASFAGFYFEEPFRPASENVRLSSTGGPTTGVPLHPQFGEELRASGTYDSFYLNVYWRVRATDAWTARTGWYARISWQIVEVDAPE